jgi:hypothetical protein
MRLLKDLNIIPVSNKKPRPAGKKAPKRLKSVFECTYNMPGNISNEKRRPCSNRANEEPVTKSPVKENWKRYQGNIHKTATNPARKKPPTCLYKSLLFVEVTTSLDKETKVTTSTAIRLSGLTRIDTPLSKPNSKYPKKDEWLRIALDNQTNKRSTIKADRTFSIPLKLLITTEGRVIQMINPTKCPGSPK